MGIAAWGWFGISPKMQSCTYRMVQGEGALSNHITATALIVFMTHKAYCIIQEWRESRQPFKKKKKRIVHVNKNE